MSPGVVYLVGAGPGDPGLITVRGLALLRRADVVLHDRLIGAALLAEARWEALLIDVGKNPGDEGASQTRINDLLVQYAKAGRTVVRLKGGDPYVFGRGFEEFTACRKAGIPCVVVPGVTSAIAGPTSAGIPITERRFVRAFAVVSAHPPQGIVSEPQNYAALSVIDTVIVMMGRETLAEVAQSLIAAGRAPETPAACVEWATTPRQRTTVATLASIGAAAERDGLRAPIVTVIGEVARFAVPEAHKDASSAEDGRSALAGKRIVITRPRSAAEPIRQALLLVGAGPVCCPLIQIAEPVSFSELDAAIAKLRCYDWVAFTSANGVRAFFSRLCALGVQNATLTRDAAVGNLRPIPTSATVGNRGVGRRPIDARVLGRCKVAAIGPATRRALRQWGIEADLVPSTATGSALAEAMQSTAGVGGGRVLLPRSDLAPAEIPRALRGCGANVDEVIAYRTMPIRPRAEIQRILGEGVDAFVFYSPSTIKSFSALGMSRGNAVIACIGPTTAAAAAKSGLGASVVPSEPTVESIVEALENHFGKIRFKKE